MTRLTQRWMIAVLLLAAAAYAVDEEMTLTTYYPSPRGVYAQLRAGGGGPFPIPTGSLHVVKPTDDGNLAFRVDDEQPNDLSPFVIDQAGNVGIGTAVPNASALLDLASTSTSPKGLLLPRLTTDERTAISAPASGLTIYNTTTNQLELFNGTKWLNASGLWAASGDHIYNLNAGNVGIWIENPAYKLHVVGSFAARYKNFEIPHPLDPEHTLLIHSSLEGPEHAVYYRGEAQLAGGKAVITLPAYFEALTHKEGRTAQLTPLGGYSPLYVEGGIENGTFVVRTTQDGTPSQKFYWEVTAVRGDIPLLVPEK